MAELRLEFDATKDLASRQLGASGDLEADHEKWEANMTPKLDRVDVVRKRGHLSLLQGGVVLAEGDQAYDAWARNDEGQAGLPDSKSGYYDLVRATQIENSRQASQDADPPSRFPLV